VKDFGISVSIVQPAAVASAIYSAMAKFNTVSSWNDPEKDATARALYPKLFSEERKKQVAQLENMASDAVVTSEAILHAIRSKYPRTRYLVGNALGIPAWALGLMAWLLPDRAIDLVM
jgi:lambda repressor-like predicted transcriptional regulator